MTDGVRNAEKQRVNVIPPIFENKAEPDGWSIYHWDATYRQQPIAANVDGMNICGRKRLTKKVTFKGMTSPAVFEEWTWGKMTL